MEDGSIKKSLFVNFASEAQLDEQDFPKVKVSGSTPEWGTIFMNRKQATSIVLEGHILTGRVSQKMQYALKHIDTAFLLLVAKEWIYEFPQLSLGVTDSTKNNANEPWKNKRVAAFP